MRWDILRHWFMHDWNQWRRSQAVGEWHLQERICNYCRQQQTRHITRDRRRARLMDQLHAQGRYEDCLLIDWEEIGYRVPVPGDRWIDRDRYGAGILGNNGWCGNDGVWPTSPKRIVKERV